MYYWNILKQIINEGLFFKGSHPILLGICQQNALNTMAGVLEYSEAEISLNGLRICLMRHILHRFLRTISKPKNCVGGGRGHC